MTIRRRGFTLFEVLMVIVLLGVLAAFMWPDFEGVMRASHLDESVMRTKALVGMCRAQAMNESRRYRLTFQPDGSLELARQKDPLTAPEQYVLVGDGWATSGWLLEDVWVEAILPMPDGPVPLHVEDDEIEFSDVEAEPVPIEEPWELYFEPDGSSGSMKWVLRDKRGRGRQLTLDGRLGRLDVTDVERLEEDQVARPEGEKVEPKEAMEIETVSP